MKALVGFPITKMSLFLKANQIRNNRTPWEHQMKSIDNFSLYLLKGGPHRRISFWIKCTPLSGVKTQIYKNTIFSFPLFIWEPSILSKLGKTIIDVFLQHYARKTVQINSQWFDNVYKKKPKRLYKQILNLF